MTNGSLWSIFVGLVSIDAQGIGTKTRKKVLTTALQFMLVANCYI